MVGRRSPRVRGPRLVGPLLAVLMSLQQGRGGVRSLITFRNAGFSRDIAALQTFSGIFGGVPDRSVMSAQRPNTALAAIMNGADFRAW